MLNAAISFKCSQLQMYQNTKKYKIQIDMQLNTKFEIQWKSLTVILLFVKSWRPTSKSCLTSLSSASSRSGAGGFWFLYLNLNFVFDYKYAHLCLLSVRGEGLKGRWKELNWRKLIQTYNNLLQNISCIQIKYSKYSIDT